MRCDQCNCTVDALMGDSCANCGAPLVSPEPRCPAFGSRPRVAGSEPDANKLPASAPPFPAQGGGGTDHCADTPEDEAASMDREDGEEEQEPMLLVDCPMAQAATHYHETGERLRVPATPQSDETEAEEAPPIALSLAAEIRAEQDHGRSKYGRGPSDFEHDDRTPEGNWHHYIADHNTRASLATPMERRQHLVKVAGLAISAIEASDRSRGKRTERSVAGNAKG